MFGGDGKLGEGGCLNELVKRYGIHANSFALYVEKKNSLSSLYTNVTAAAHYDGTKRHDDPTSASEGGLGNRTSSSVLDVKVSLGLNLSCL